MRRSLIFDRIIPVLALIVASVAAYYAYKSYTKDYEAPVLSLMFFQGEGKDERNLNSIIMESGQVNLTNHMSEVDLPLVIVNDSDKDAEKLTIWISLESKEVELQSKVDWWRCEQFSSTYRCVSGFSHVPPHSEIKAPGIVMRSRENFKDIKLNWEVICARIPPTKGSLSLKLS